MARSRRDALEKVVKMLRLARAAGTEAEAQTALALAQKLMYAHGLEAEDVEGDTSDVESIDEEMVDHASNRLGWREYLAAVIAENFRCAYIMSHPRSAPNAVRLVFVGRTHDVAAASAAYRAATVAGETLAYRFVDETGGSFESYLSGFLAGLDQRFRENVTESALAIRLEDAVMESARSLTNAGDAEAAILPTADAGAVSAGYDAGFAYGDRKKRLS
jgi:hypothetical protein